MLSAFAKKEYWRISSVVELFSVVEMAGHYAWRDDSMQNKAL
jgi:hypothetical protein